MSRIGAIALGTLFSVAASAQSGALQCASPDVVNAFVLLSSDGSTLVIGADRPQQLAGHEAPPEFEWIGTRSTDRDTRAAYKTSLAAEDARAAFVASLSRAGFEIGERDDNPGFETTAPPLLDVVCRDGQAGTVMTRDIGGARYVTTSFFTRTGPRDCTEVLLTPRQRSRGGFGYIPSLELPRNVVMSTRAGALPTGVGSGSGDTYRSMLEVEGVGSMAGLVESLNEQLRAQGWVPDAGWSGTLSAGSTWTRETDGITLAGKLEVRALAGGGYHHLEFKLMQIG